MANDDEKTEEPTPKKLEDARKKGDVPQSREFASFIVFFALALALYFGSGYIGELISTSFRNAFLLNKHLIENPVGLQEFLETNIYDLLKIVSPIFMAVFIFGIIAYVGQFGFLFTTEKLMPNFGKINPLSGIKRIFSKDTAVELIKSILKVLTFTVILYFMFRGEIKDLIEIGSGSIPAIFDFMMSSIAKLMAAVLLFVAVLGIADFAYQRWSYSQKQKMSMKEIKDEYKNREGDPQVKARIRQIQRDRARARMMEKVPQADVVVANPTHVAVALKYERGRSSAPIVVAKGAGFIALKIKTLAIESGVPVLEKRSLARYLYRHIEVGQGIPESLFSAVAEVLAYVYKVKKKYKSIGLPAHLRGAS